MLIDTHAHVYKEFYDDLSEVEKNSKENEVYKIVNCATKIKDFKEIINNSNIYESFYFSLGVHPEELESNVDYKQELEKYVVKNLENKKFIAIGEVGLDYYYTKDNKEGQKELLTYQLDLASKYDLPVIIHSRDATEDTIKILKKYNLKGVVHCFSGSLETAKIYINMGYKLGIGGLVTFKNCNLKNIIKEIGIENIVLETDSPFLTPHPYRSLKNEPMYIKNIAESLSQIFEIPLSEIAKITYKNACEIFDFNK